VIEEVVKPDDIAVDLGSGTGILGLFACRAGAARVYALDDSGLEREIFASNGFADRAVCVKGLSTRVRPPELADVAVGELIGRFGFDGGIVQYFADARHRLLKPRARMIPSRIDLCVAPLEAPKIWEEVDFWKRSPAGFNLERAYSIAINTGHPTKCQRQQILAEPAVIATIELTKDSGPTLSGKVTSIVRRGATLHGIGAWFMAELSTSVSLTNSPCPKIQLIGARSFFLWIHRHGSKWMNVFKLT
jgi:enediyne biosynthesis protein CalE3